MSTNVALTTRIVIVIGSLIVIGFADAIAGAIWHPLAAYGAAAAGYLVGIVAHKYWTPKP